MLNFRNFLTEALSVVGVKAGHMSHAEDLVFDLGVDGTRMAIHFLLDVRDMLSVGDGSKKQTVTVKFDGCLHEDTKLLTNHGEISIKDIVENPHAWENTAVMGINLNSPIPIPKLAKIEGGSCSDGDKKWVRVNLEHGELIMTEDHEVYTTNRGWVKAGELLPCDDIFEMGRQPSKFSK